MAEQPTGGSASGGRSQTLAPLKKSFRFRCFPWWIPPPRREQQRSGGDITGGGGGEREEEFFQYEKMLTTLLLPPSSPLPPSSLGVRPPSCCSHWSVGLRHIRTEQVGPEPDTRTRLHVRNIRNSSVSPQNMIFRTTHFSFSDSLHRVVFKASHVDIIFYMLNFRRIKRLCL